MNRWLIGIVAVAVATAGWLGWREAQWRRTYYADVTGHLIYHVEMAHRKLVRAREARTYDEKVDAMATAHGYLVPAQEQALKLLERIAPFRKGRPAFMPKHHVPMLLQYAGSLTPELPDQALQKRIELVGGLEKALKAGLTDRRVEPSFNYAVDIPKLKQSLDDFFRPMSPDPPFIPRFEDEPNHPTVTARQEGSDVRLRVDWGYSFQVFPHMVRGYLVLIRPATGVEISSDIGPQRRMGQAAFEPFSRMTEVRDLHQGIEAYLPKDWTAGSYAVVWVPEGLPQTLTLRLPGGAGPDLLLLRPGSGEKAVPIPVQQ